MNLIGLAIHRKYAAVRDELVARCDRDLKAIEVKHGYVKNKDESSYWPEVTLCVGDYLEKMEESCRDEWKEVFGVLG